MGKDLTEIRSPQSNSYLTMLIGIKYEHRSLRGTATYKASHGGNDNNGALYCESEYDRGAGCGKTARPDLYGGC